MSTEKYLLNKGVYFHAKLGLLFAVHIDFWYDCRIEWFSKEIINHYLYRMSLHLLVNMVKFSCPSGDCINFCNNY